eukprot:6164230-Amphidinium_carterae.1
MLRGHQRSVRSKPRFKVPYFAANIYVSLSLMYRHWPLFDGQSVTPTICGATGKSLISQHLLVWPTGK